MSCLDLQVGHKDRGGHRYADAEHIKNYRPSPAFFNHAIKIRVAIRRVCPSAGKHFHFVLIVFVVTEGTLSFRLGQISLKINMFMV